MDLPVLIKSGESIWELDRGLLEKSSYFTSHLSGHYRLTQIDRKTTFILEAEWEGPLSDYIYFLKHRLVESRIIGDDYALALYLGDEDYLQLCDEAPKISGGLAKLLRHNHKLKKIWSKLDQRDMTRRLYFSELSDEEFDLVVKNWPKDANYVHAAQEWSIRRGIKNLPSIFSRSPSFGTLLKLPYSSVWALWFLQSLDDYEEVEKKKQRYTNVFMQLGRLIEQQTQKFILAPPTVELISLVNLPVDDAWIYQAVQYVRREFSGYQRKTKAIPTAELKLKAGCISVLAKKLREPPSATKEESPPVSDSSTVTRLLLVGSVALGLAALLNE